ncbi:MAG: nuclear transport factor 2 family protein [Arenimonas sp.]|nr:nuclear transport factor 2 family protein [Arenimonas sp.]
MKTSIIAISLGLAMAGNVHAACSSADKAALEAFDRAWAAASEKGDATAMAAYYSDDYQGLAPGGGMDKQAAIADAIANAREGGDAVVTKPDFYQIHCSGNTAVISHRNVTTSGTGDEAETWYGRSVHHMVKEGGDWKVLSNTGHPLGDGGIVTYLDLEWNIAELAGDKAWFERNLAEDYVGVTSREGSLETKEQLIAALGTYKVTQADSTDVRTNVDGDRAQVTGIYHTSGTDKDGKAFQHKTRYIDTFVKRDGRWQIWSSQGTPVTP